VNRILRCGITVTRDLHLDRLEREGLKTQDERRVHVGPLMVEVLQSRWRHQLQERLAARARWQGPDYMASTPTGYIFTGASGTPIQPRAIDKFFAEVRERAGLDVQRFHGLRRISRPSWTGRGSPTGW